MSAEKPKLQVYRSLDEVPAGFGPAVATIGNFDGVHLGHRDVLDAVASEARGLKYRAVAITFDPHPEQVLRPKIAGKLITPMPERLRLLAETNISDVLILPFDAAFACMTARDCVRDVLAERLQVRSIHEGANFRFGHRAEAGVLELAEFGREFGFTVHVHPAVVTRGLTVSSTAIRQCVAEGDLRRARWMLGHTFSVRSRPARGRGIGTKLLVPTVNLAAYDGLLPAFGVYVTRLTIPTAAGERCFQAVTNVGNRPTFGEPSFAVESYLLDYQPELEPVEFTEETPVELEFLMRLRAEIAWPSPEALKAQIMKDVARAKRFFRL